jgi:hypothetical protein
MHLNIYSMHICMLYGICIGCDIYIYIVYELYVYNIILEFVFTSVISI